MTPDHHLQASDNDRDVAACYADCHEPTQQLWHSLIDSPAYDILYTVYLYSNMSGSKLTGAKPWQIENLFGLLCVCLCMQGLAHVVPVNK